LPLLLISFFGLSKKEGFFGLSKKEGFFGLSKKEGFFGLSKKEGFFGLSKKKRRKEENKQKNKTLTAVGVPEAGSPQSKKHSKSSQFLKKGSVISTLSSVSEKGRGSAERCGSEAAIEGR